MFNQVIVFGRIVSDPEYRQTQGGTAVCSFTVAVDRQKKDTGADFIKCVCFSKTAEMVSKYFAKGKPILVVGKIQNNDYTDKNGVKHYSYVVLVNSVSFSINDNSQNRAVEVGQGTYQGNYTPSYQNAVQGGYNANRGYQQSSPYPPLPSEDTSGGYDDFEEILNDGTIPF